MLLWIRHTHLLPASWKEIQLPNAFGSHELNDINHLYIRLQAHIFLIPILPPLLISYSVGTYAFAAQNNEDPEDLEL